MGSWRTSQGKWELTKNDTSETRAELYRRQVLIIRGVSGNRRVKGLVRPRNLLEGRKSTQLMGGRVLCEDWLLHLLHLQHLLLKGLHLLLLLLLLLLLPSDELLLKLLLL